MAGDWIKMRTNLDTDPKVLQIAVDLGLDELQVVGALWKVWSWADSHSLDGNAINVTHVMIDRFTRLSGFADALRKVGWLEGRDNALSFPRFAEHNGQTAKKRAETRDRVAKHREKSRNANPTTSVTHKALPEKRREEKRREEEKPKERERGVVSQSLFKNQIESAVIRARGLFAMRPATKLDRSQLLAVKNAEDVLVELSEQDWKTLEAYYAAPQSQTYSRKSLAAFLNNINGELSKAQNWVQGKRTKTYSDGKL